MEKIASFAVNHDLLEKGMYVSRIDGDVVTYDIRMKSPTRAIICRWRRRTRLSIFLPPMPEILFGRQAFCMLGRWAAVPGFI